MIYLDFVEVCNLDELRENRRKVISIGNDQIALFYFEGKVYAINNICAHKGGPLDEGKLDDEEVICPWHGFMYNIKTGVCLNHPGFSVKTFKVKVENEKVMISLS